MRKALLAPLVVGLVAATPAVAHAGTLTVSGTQLVYRAAPGETNDFAMKVSGFDSKPGALAIEVSDKYPITQTDGTSCPQSTSDRDLVCNIGTPNVQMDVDLGDGNDKGTVNGDLDLTSGSSAVLRGGDGDDDLQMEEITGTLDGANGNDTLEPDTNYMRQYNELHPVGGQSVAGGPGSDTLKYLNLSGRSTRSISLDDLANDGDAGEGDNIHSDVENVMALGDGPWAINGSAAPNVITSGGGDDVINGLDGDDQIRGGRGNDKIDGGAGNDTLLGGAGNDAVTAGPGTDNVNGDDENPQTNIGNDTINLVDGAPGDAATCGLGADTVTNDKGDNADPGSCESVTTSGATGGPTPPPGPGGSTPYVTLGALKHKANHVQLPVTCKRSATCSGTLTLRTASKVRIGHGKAKTYTLGHAKLSIAAGKTKTIKVTLTKTARVLVRHHKVLKVNASASSGSLHASRKLNLRR